MPLHLAARLHAFLHGLFRPSDLAETRHQYNKVVALLERQGLRTAEQQADALVGMAIQALASFDCPADHPQIDVAHRLVTALIDDDGLFLLPEMDWQERRSITELWNIRDFLKVQRGWLEAYPDIREHLLDASVGFLAPLYKAYPQLLSDASEQDGITIPTNLLHCLGDIGTITEKVIHPAYADNLVDAGLLAHLRTRLDRNLIAASGGNPDDPEGFKRAPKWPTQSDIKDPETLVGSYLGGTPLHDLFSQDTEFTIPTKSRFEHHHIVAGSGHGKTQTLQYLIGQDIAAMDAGDPRSVIVIDSQGDLIRNISNLAVFAPGGPLHDRIVIIDPTDIEWPVSLNLFDVGQDRLQGYAPLERERLTNSILELYDFVLGTLLDAQMTQKQSVIFRYVTRLMLHIPDATIHTLRELMELDSHIKFAKSISQLSGTAKHFFETEFTDREFAQTKKQVLRRLWGILENQTFERMFSHPRSKLDLFGEMNAGKVILFNTAKDLLKETGTEIFGRFFIAMIAQAAQERATLPVAKRTPTIVYIDEAADYFDRNIAIILAQARKYNVGMVLAHQYLGQLDPKLQEAFAANTSIKFAGGVSAKDARALAPMLYCEPAFIESRGKGSFAAHVRGVTPNALPLSFPFGYMERRPQMSAADRQDLQTLMRQRYAVHHTELGKVDQDDDEPDQPSPEEPEDKSDEPPVPGTDASPEL